ncbi:MAG: hypothetical protein ACRCTZ_16825 [Sarcina sp.]
MIQFKNKISEFKYNAKFYNGDLLESYKTIFTEEKINKIIYDLSIKNDNLKQLKIKQHKEFEKFNKYSKWVYLGISIFFALIGLFVFIPFILVMWIGSWVIVECKKDSLVISNLPTDKQDIADLHNGKYLSNINKSVYSHTSLDFFENQKLIYEYNYFKACTQSSENGFVTYYWKETHEVVLIPLDSLEEITYSPEGITLKGTGYFPRYNGHTYYSYPYVFIPSYVENFDEILERFKALKTSDI